MGGNQEERKESVKKKKKTTSNGIMSDKSGQGTGRELGETSLQRIIAFGGQKKTRAVHEKCIIALRERSQQQQETVARRLKTQYFVLSFLL